MPCCLRFGEIDSNIRIPSDGFSSLGKNSTLMFWIRWFGESFEGEWASVYDPAPDQTKHHPFGFFSGCYPIGSFGAHQYSLQIMPGGLKVNLSWVTNGTFNDGANLTGYISFPHAVWHHVAVVFENYDPVKVYVNGSLTFQWNNITGYSNSPSAGGTANDTYAEDIEGSGYHDYVIGNAYDAKFNHPDHTIENDSTETGPWYCGVGADMFGIRIYKRALTAEEINELFYNWWDHYTDTNISDSDLVVNMHLDEGAGDIAENLAGANGNIHNCIWVCEDMEWVPPGGGGPSYPIPKIWAHCTPDPVNIGAKTNVTWVTSFANYVDIYETHPNSRYIGNYTTVGSIPYYPMGTTNFHLIATRTDEPRGNPYVAHADAAVHLHTPVENQPLNGERLIISDSGNFRLVIMGTSSLDWRGALGTHKRYQYGMWDWWDEYPVTPRRHTIVSTNFYVNDENVYNAVGNPYNAGGITKWGIDNAFRYSHGGWMNWMVFFDEPPNLQRPRGTIGMGANSGYLYSYDFVFANSLWGLNDAKHIWNKRNAEDNTSVSCIQLDQRSWWGANSLGYPWYGPVWQPISGSQGLHGDTDQIKMHPAGGKFYTVANNYLYNIATPDDFPPVNVIRMYDVESPNQAILEAYSLPSSQYRPQMWMDVSSEFVYVLMKGMSNSQTAHFSIWDTNSLTCIQSGIVVNTHTVMNHYLRGEGIAYDDGHIYAFAYDSTNNRNYINKITTSGWTVVQSWGSTGSMYSVVTSDCPDARGFISRMKYPYVDRQTHLLYGWDSDNHIHKSFTTMSLGFRAVYDFKQIWGDEGLDNMFYEPWGICAKNYTPGDNVLSIAVPGTDDGDTFNVFMGSDFQGYGTARLTQRIDLHQLPFGRYSGHWSPYSWQVAIASAWLGDGISGAYQPDPPGYACNPVGVTMDNSGNTYVYLNEANFNQQAIVKLHKNLSILKVNTYGGGGVYPPNWYSPSGYSWFWEFYGMDYDPSSNLLWMQDGYDGDSQLLAWMDNSLTWVGSYWLEEHPILTPGENWYGRGLSVFSKHIYLTGDSNGEANVVVLDKDTRDLIRVFTPTNPNGPVRYSALCHDGRNLYFVDPMNSCVDKYKPDMTLILRSPTFAGVGSGYLFGPMGITYYKPDPLSTPFYKCDDTPGMWEPMNYTPPERQIGVIPFHMFKIRIGSGTNDYIALQNSDRPLAWGGKEWLKYPATVGTVKFRSVPSDSVKVSASGVHRELVKDMILHRVVGKEVTVYKCYWNNDFTHTEPYVLFNGQVESFNVEEDDKSASVNMELKTDHWNWTHQVPNHGFGVFCNWRFKSTTPGCQYTGVHTVCDKSWLMCDKYGNTDRFRGFRYMADLEEKVIWWGKEKKL